MASCKHCGKDSLGFALCVTCTTILASISNIAGLTANPPKDGLAAVGYNRRLRKALKELRAIHPVESDP